MLPHPVPLYYRFASLILWLLYAYEKKIQICLKIWLRRNLTCASKQATLEEPQS